MKGGLSGPSGLGRRWKAWRWQSLEKPPSRDGEQVHLAGEEGPFPRLIDWPHDVGPVAWSSGISDHGFGEIHLAVACKAVWSEDQRCEAT